jgi:pimeloyl-ACP methyl ester carboxylesterase
MRLKKTLTSEVIAAIHEVRQTGGDKIKREVEIMSNSGNQFRSIRLSQGTIRYRDVGEGAPIVFVHGALVNGELWRKVVPLFSGRYRCIIPDLPLGSHQTAMNKDADLSPQGLAQLIADFLTAVDLQAVTLVGNDTGGALCQIVVTNYPERIAQLVLTNCDAFDNFPPKMFLPLKWGAYVPGFLFELSQLLRFQTIRYSPLAFGWLSKRRIEKRVMDNYLNPAISSRLIRRDLGKALKGLSTKYTLEAAKKLADFHKPVLLAWATEDRFFKFTDAERLSKIIPNAQLERIADSLTFVPEDQPERLAQLIDGFMQKHQATRNELRLLSVV